MRILILGAGAVGGYFGGRMVAAGSDVTFLVRPGRAEQLQRGLRIESPRGDAAISVKTIVKGQQPDTPFDVILLSCKAYGLDDALDAVAPFVGNGTPILPLLNGQAHLAVAQGRFPQAVVWGGTAGIAATLTPEGIVRQMMPVQTITGGLLEGQTDPEGRLKTLIGEMQQAGINAVLSDNIQQLMWDKWAFLATLAAANCLTSGSIAEIHATDHGEKLILGLYAECNRTATAEGYPPNPAPVQDYRGTLLDKSLPMTASMLRDMEGGGPTEAHHILGGMIAYATKHGIDTPYLQAAYTALQVYEAKRAG